jgi:hypothetical protein
MRELIDDGRTGFVVTDADGAVAAVDRVADLDRDLVRTVAVERFHHDRMVDAYLDVYAGLLADRSGAGSSRRRRA